MNRMEEFKKILNTMHTIIDKIKKLLNKTYNRDFNLKVDEAIQNLKSKVLNVIDYYPEYEEILQNKDRNSGVNLIEEVADRESTMNNQSLLMNRTSEIDALRTSLLEVAEIQSQEQFMVKREEKLNDIHLVSTQINQITRFI